MKPALRTFSLSTTSALLIIGGLYLADRWYNRKIDAAERAGAAQVRAILHGHASWVQRMAHLRAVEDYHMRRAAAFADSARRLALALGAGKDSALPPFVAPADSGLSRIVNLWMGAYDECVAGARSCKARADSAEARAAQVEGLLEQEHRRATCHILGASFLPSCPSRTASVVMGIVLGILAVKR